MPENKFFFSNPDWISPRRSEEDKWRIAFNPNQMDSSGIIYFKDLDMPTYLTSFVASRIKIKLKKSSGPRQVFLDFVGKFFFSLHYNFYQANTT